MQGKELIECLKQATGLPDGPLSRELDKLFAENGLSAEELTLENLRTLLASYLQDVLLATKEDLEHTS